MAPVSTMARIFLPERLHALATDVLEVGGVKTVSSALAALFSEYPRLRGYLLDDQGLLRERVAIYVDGLEVVDPRRLADPVAPDADIRVLPRLSARRPRLRVAGEETAAQEVVA